MFEPSQCTGKEGNLNCAVGPSHNTLTSIPERMAQKQVIRTVAVCDLGSANYNFYLKKNYPDKNNKIIFSNYKCMG